MGPCTLSPVPTVTDVDGAVQAAVIASTPVHSTATTVAAPAHWGLTRASGWGELMGR